MFRIYTFVVANIPGYLHFPRFHCLPYSIGRHARFHTEKLARRPQIILHILSESLSIELKGEGWNKSVRLSVLPAHFLIRSTPSPARNTQQPARDKLHRWLVGGSRRSIQLKNNFSMAQVKYCSGMLGSGQKRKWTLVPIPHLHLVKA